MIRDGTVPTIDVHELRGLLEAEGLSVVRRRPDQKPLQEMKLALAVNRLIVEKSETEY